MQLIGIRFAAARGLALNMLFTLVACIDLKQSIEINDDLATYRMEMRMNATLAQEAGTSKSLMRSFNQ